MESDFPARRLTPATRNLVAEVSRDSRVARDVAPGEPWVFFDHRTLAEIIAAERGQ